MDETDIAVKVTGGEVTSSDLANSYLSKYHAEIETRRIKGVMAVANDIVVKPLSGPDRIMVDTRSWSERDQAQCSAWSAPGVTNVKDELTVRS